MRIMLVILLLVVSLNANADEDPVSGNALLNSCQYFINETPTKAVGFYEYGQCLGYISGMADALNSVGKGICFPPTAPYEQYVRVVYKYLQEYPESLHKHRQELVVRAFLNAFPCN